MTVMMAYVHGGQPFKSSEAKGVFLEINPDTVDMGKQFSARAIVDGVINGDEWRLWSAPDSRPVEDRVIFGQRTAAGWNPIHRVTLI